MSDRGNIALTAQNDVSGCATWEDFGVECDSLSASMATGFVTFEYERTPIMG